MENLVNGLHSLRGNLGDWPLTLLTTLLLLIIFVFAPLQAMGFPAVHALAIGGLLAITGSALIVSSPTALALMSIALVANVAVFWSRLYYPWQFNLHLLAGAWLIAAVTLGTVVGQEAFAGGRVTYHRIIGAVLVYVLMAVAFATLFVFVGVSFPNAIKGITFEDDPALANTILYASFATLTTTGYGDIVPVHPLMRSLFNIESVIGHLYPATLLARLVTLELQSRRTES